MPDYPFTIWFRRALRLYLDDRRITRNELAQKLATTGATLHRYDRGLSFPDVDMQSKLAGTFGVAEDEVARLVRESEKRRRREAEHLDRSERPTDSQGRKVPPTGRATWLGRMAGTGRILGDVVAPTTKERDWDALW